MTGAATPAVGETGTVETGTGGAPEIGDHRATGHGPGPATVTMSSCS